MTFNSVSDAILEKPDLLDREAEVLKDIHRRLDFTSKKRLGDSRYWVKTHAGAVFYQGIFKDQPAVLKIQGVKPPVSEIDQIQAFAAQNQSSLIRPPHLLAFLRWSADRRYEALVLEQVTGGPAINFPTTAPEVTRFYTLYQEYRRHCRAKPWLPQPTQSLPQLIETDFANWRHIRHQLFPHHPLFQTSDETLINQAITLLKQGYQRVEPEFLHGHFSYHDVYQQGRQWVLFSNLFWKYKAPFYDAVFNQHWFVFHLASVKGMTQAKIKAQHQLWLTAIFKLGRTTVDQKLINLALLERAAAGLNLDALSLDLQNPFTPFLYDYTRKRLQYLIKQCA